MFICDSRRLLFVHIQKTGGVAVTRTLEEALPDGRAERGPHLHDPLRRVLARRPDAAKYWIFGIVRNPWARMVSWWSMIRDHQARAEAGDPVSVEWMRTTPFRSAIAAMPDFATFVAEAPERWEVFRRPQVRWLTSPTRRADFVARTETLTIDLRAVFARFELPMPDEVRTVNTSNHGDFRGYYSAAARARVGEIFADDVAAFGYEF